MVFPSIPAYLDPSNWQQQPNHQHHHHQHQQQHHQHQHQHGVGGGGVSSQLLPPAPTPPPPPPSRPLPQPHGSGGGAGSIRPGSMADRARMANIPMPETQLKCPRCESSNTKFCYFNNYSLTQPRHFCKTCRRYWTRGGALRNVPVGGGCRRNKRSKGSGSSNKSPATSSDRQTASGASSSTLSSNSGPTTSDMLLGLGPQIPPLRFMAPLHFNEFASSDHMGLNYPGLSCGPIGGAGSDLSFQIGTALAGLGGGGGGAGGSSLFGGGLEQWRNIQQGGGGHQFPFLGGLDSTSSGLYPFESGAEPSGYGIDLAVNHHNQVRPKMLITTSSIATQLASVKMEDSNQDRMNLSRQLLGINANNPVVAGNESTTPQYWSGPAWSTDLSSFSSSSTSNQL